MVFFFEIGKIFTVAANLFRKEDYRRFTTVLAWEISVFSWKASFMTGFPDFLLYEVNSKNTYCGDRPKGFYKNGDQCSSCGRLVLNK